MKTETHNHNSREKAMTEIMNAGIEILFSDYNENLNENATGITVTPPVTPAR